MTITLRINPYGALLLGCAVGIGCTSHVDPRARGNSVGGSPASQISESGGALGGEATLSAPDRASGGALPSAVGGSVNQPASSGGSSTGGAVSAGAAGANTGGVGAVSTGGNGPLIATLPNPLDPAATDPDFAIQGEYVGSVGAGAAEQTLGAQIIALGNAQFRAVFEPGGLPGNGFTGTKIDVNGMRQGTVATFAPNISAAAMVETGGLPGNYHATIDQGMMTGTDEQGRPFTLRKVLRESPTLARKPPVGAIVLFDGTGTSEFVQGAPNDYPNTYFPGEGGMTADGLLKEGATTVRNFADCTLHVEFREPFQPDLNANERGNSGVFLQGAYEVNIQDSFGTSGSEGAGVIWGVRDADINMSFPPLSWQTFDIDFHAARWNGAQKIQNARMSVTFNGAVVNQDVEIPDATEHNPLPELNAKGPIFLQANPYPVRFRYVWVVEK